MSYNNTLNQNINQYYYYQQQQQQQTMGGGGTQNTQYLSRQQKQQQQPYNNMNYFKAAPSNSCVPTANSSTCTIVPTAASNYYDSHLYNNYAINNNNSNNHRDMFFNPSAAAFNANMNSATTRSSTSKNPTAAPSTPSSSSGSKRASDWLDVSPLQDDPLSLHPYYGSNQHSSNNYATATNSYNNNNHHRYHGDMVRTNNATNSNNHQGLYFTSNNTLYTHYNHAVPNNNNTIQHMKYPQQQLQQQVDSMNNSNRTSQLSNQVMQHPTTHLISNTATTTAHTRNMSSTSNSIFPYSPSDFDPVDVFKTHGNYSNNEYRTAADQHHRNSSSSSSSAIPSRTTAADNTKTISTTYESIFPRSDESCNRTNASTHGNGTPSPLLYQQEQLMIQPPVTNYLNCDNKDDLSPFTNNNHNSNIVDSQPIIHATSKTTTATRMVSEAYQQVTTESITVTISGISSQPLSSSDILQIVISRGTDVKTKYLPCVEFLVLCQQELRKAVEKNQKLPVKQRCSPKQFYSKYFLPLHKRFYEKNYGTMPTDHLKNASEAIKTLLAETKKNESLGCDQMKITFLGGMREGQSWGLRNWLSKYGSALQICNELEMILVALQKLDQSSKLTIDLASQIRKEASVTRARLLNEVPLPYQQKSSAHPFLPFFHRLDMALKGLAEFDPEDDDVVILDDDEQEKLKAMVAAAGVQKKMSRGSTERRQKSNKRTAVEILEVPDDLHVPDTAETNNSWKRRATNTTTGESSNNSTGSSEANTTTDTSDGVPTLDSADLALFADNDGRETSYYPKKSPSVKNTRFDIQGGSLSPTPFSTLTTGVDNSRYSGGVDGTLDELACEDDFSHIFDNDSNVSTKLFNVSDTTTRDSYIPSQGDWRCNECELINASIDDHCIICGCNKALSTTRSQNSFIDSPLLLF